MLIKICGLTNRQDAETAIALGADFVGFIFVPGSPRAVVPAEADWIRDLQGAATVGVFVDAFGEHIIDVKSELGLDWIQLHGNEPDALIDDLGGEVIRRVVPSDPMDWVHIQQLGRKCVPLLDPGGGSGKSWDWAALSVPPPGTRFGLAGGLTPESVAAPVQKLNPWMVDVSSGVESAPGRKDRHRVKGFIDTARRAVESSSC